MADSQHKCCLRRACAHHRPAAPGSPCMLQCHITHRAAASACPCIAPQARRAERAAAVQAERVQAVRGAEQGLAAAEERAAAAQQALRRAREELEKRITEHDMCVDEKKPEELVRVTLDQVGDGVGVLLCTSLFFVGAVRRG